MPAPTLKLKAQVFRMEKRAFLLLLFISLKYEASQNQLTTNLPFSLVMKDFVLVRTKYLLLFYRAKHYIKVMKYRFVFLQFLLYLNRTKYEKANFIFQK